MPSSNGKAVRWAYGNWNWYALENNGPLDALGALLIPSKSTLGRREMADPKDVESLKHSIPLWIQYVYVIKVERDREQKLLQRLEKEFNENDTIEVITRPSD